MAKSVASDYARTYTTFSGCDIVATFGNVGIGALQAITYHVFHLNMMTNCLIKYIILIR